jgi:hypothetical protein
VRDERIEILRDESAEAFAIAVPGGSFSALYSASCNQQ